MKRFLLLTSVAFLIFQSCSKIGEKTPKNQVSVLNPGFAFDIVFYFTQDSIKRTELIEKAKTSLTGFKLHAKFPDSIVSDGFLTRHFNNLAQDYHPPDTSYLAFSSYGLSNEQKVALANSSTAIVITLFGTPDNVLEKQKQITKLISTVSEGKNVFIGDLSAISYFNPASWKEVRENTLTGKNILNQIVVHTYREQEFCRIVTLGMAKFCLPDISIKDISCNDQNTYGTLVNSMIATLIENPKINVDSTLQIDLEKISDEKMRKAVSYDLKENAAKKAEVSVRFVAPEPGDDLNMQLRVIFEDPAFSSPQEQQNKVLADLFGFEESYKLTTHDEELLAASERAKSKLPALMSDFNKGYAPGYSLLLKLPFKTDSGGNEWMWVEVTKWNGEVIEGILQNDPYEVSNLKAGAIVKCKQQDVFDYILSKPDGSMEGNETGEIIEQKN